jgi:CBS domain.
MAIEAVPVEKLMTTDLVTVSPDADVETAADTILNQEAGSLVALDDDGHISGFSPVPTSQHSSLKERCRPTRQLATT